MKKLIGISLLMLLLLGCVPASATDYTTGYEILRIAPSGTTGSIKSLYIPDPLSLTAGTFAISGRNATSFGVTDEGIYDYGTGSATCNLPVYAIASPYNYTFDVSIEYLTTNRSTYDTDYFVAYTITNIKTGNLSASRTEFDARGSCGGNPASKFMYKASIRVAGSPLAFDDTTAPLKNRIYNGISTAVKVGYYDFTPYVPPAPPNSSIPVIRTYVQTLDNLGGSIGGSTIALKNVKSGNWTNRTTESNGVSYIDIFSNQTFDAWGSMAGFSTASRFGLVPITGAYDLTLWPVGSLPNPGTGNVNLVFLVSNAAGYQPISGGLLQVTTAAGATSTQLTNGAGSAVFVVPNSSVVTWRSTATGFTTQSGSITTTAFGPDTQRVEMRRTAVTTVPTTVPGDPGATATPTPLATIDTRTSAEKQSALMDLILNNAESLIGLAIIMTMLYMVGYKP